MLEKKVPGLAHDAPNPDKMAKRCVQEVADNFIANRKVETPHFIAVKLYGQEKWLIWDAGNFIASKKVNSFYF